MPATALSRQAQVSPLCLPCLASRLQCKQQLLDHVTYSLERYTCHRNDLQDAEGAAAARHQCINKVPYMPVTWPVMQAAAELN